MKIPEFVHGSIAPTFTVFDANLKIDEQGQRNLLDYLVQAGGISSFFIRSGLGQMYTFTFDEVKQLAKLTCEHLSGKAPVLVGSNGVWDRNRDRRPDPETFTKEGVELSRYAESIGAAGVVHTVPEAILPREGETIRDVFVNYFTAINDAVNIPIFVYQPPGTDAAYRMTPELITAVAEIPNCVGAKISNTDGHYLFDICQASVANDFACICGAETAFYAALMAGSCAVIGGGATLNPHILNAIQQRFETGDLPGMLVAQAAANRLVVGIHNPVNWFKRYVTEKGYPVSEHFRRMTDNPYVTDYLPISDDDYKRFKRVYEEEMSRFGASA
jgi:4-hydroxy-tetrahydrodipicolinate synthase